MSTLLVTGGNGFVGRHLVEVAGRAGHIIRVLALPGEDVCWLERRGVAVYRGDIREPDQLEPAVRGADAVVHLAAMMHVWRPVADYRAVNVTGTENVCRAALRAGVRRLVHVSSSSVYGLGLGRPVDESFPLAPFPDPYPVTKAESDAAVQRMIAKHRLPAVIIRPDQVFGPGDSLHFGRMAARLQRGRGFIVGSGHNRLPMVYVADLVQALLLALDRDEAVGQAYNIGADRPLTQRQFLTAIAAEVGGRPVAVHVPFHVLYAAGYVAERLAAGGCRPPVTRLGVAFIGTDNRYSIGKAERELDYVPQVPLAEGVRLAAAWYAGSRGEPADGRSQPGQPLRHSVTAQVRS